MKPIRIIYVLCCCWGNHDRSPAVAAILRVLLAARGIHAIVESCGTTENPREGEFAGASALSTAFLAERGIDISKHRARRACDIDLSGWHVYPVVGAEIRDVLVQRAVPRNRIWVLNEPHGIPNPWGRGAAAYAEAITCIDRSLVPLVEHIVERFDELVSN